MPNNFALLALLTWPLIGILIFRMMKDREQAIIASFVWSFLFLPAGIGIDLPGLPPFDKRNIPVIFLTIMILFSRIDRVNILPSGILIWIILFLYVGGRFLTAILNGDPVILVNRVIPGTGFRDAAFSIFGSIMFILPFLIGYGFLYSRLAHLKLVYTLIVAGLIYSVILFIEVRLSPQFHIWVYGYFPHSFLQQIRSGGFRPVGFLNHGLYSAFFVMTCCAIAFILLKERKFRQSLPELSKINIRFDLVAAYLFFLLILCKSLGSLILGIIVIFCVLFFKPKLQVKIAAILVAIGMLFPILRGNDIFPTESILKFAGSISEERADSLRVRFVNEDKLLMRASQRPIFGWGGWGRNRIFSERTGRDLSILDGYWIGVFGTAGWVGFIAVFSLLATPVFMILRRYRAKESENLSPITSGLCLLLAANMIELLPNSTLFPWTWLIAGALWGHAVKVLPAGDAVKVEGKELPKRPRTIL